MPDTKHLNEVEDALGNLQVAISPIDLRWLVDRVQLAFLVTWY